MEMIKNLLIGLGLQTEQKIETHWIVTKDEHYLLTDDEKNNQWVEVTRYLMSKSWKEVVLEKLGLSSRGFVPYPILANYYAKEKNIFISDDEKKQNLLLVENFKKDFLRRKESHYRQIEKEYQKEHEQEREQQQILQQEQSVILQKEQKQREEQKRILALQEQERVKREEQEKIINEIFLPQTQNLQIDKNQNTSQYYENIRLQNQLEKQKKEADEREKRLEFQELNLNLSAREKIQEIKEFAFEIHSKNERQMIDFLELSMNAKFDRKEAELSRKDAEQVRQETEILKKANELQSQVALFEVEKNKLLLTAFEHHLKNENEKLDLRSQSIDNQKILDEAKRIEQNADDKMKIYELQTREDKLELQRMVDNLHNEKAKQIITDMLFNLRDKESGIKDQLQRLQYGTMEQTILFKEQKHLLELSKFDLEKEEMNIKSEKMTFQRSIDDMLRQFFGGGVSMRDAGKFFGRISERDRQLKIDERYANEREKNLDARANELSNKQYYLDHRDRNLDERERNLGNVDKK